MKNIGIIPARSGSKGLKNKNILPLIGKPLIAYTIEAAIQSEVFDYIMVSTDSKMYAEIAKNAGAKVPFLRTDENASDQASSWAVVREVLAKLKEMGMTFDVVTLLQPTSPLRNSDEIRGAFALYKEKCAKTVVSVCEVGHPLEWSFHLDDSFSMKEYASSPARHLRRQDIPKRYIENGAIYITRAADVMNTENDIYSEDCFAYVMKKESSCDIDNELDLLMAEMILQQNNS